MAEWFVGPIMEKIINACSDYLEEQVEWQTGMKKELESLRENHPKIQAIVFAANQAQISDQNPALNKWIWQLRDAVDEADDVLDEFDYMKHKEQLTKNMEETEKRTAFSNASFLTESASKIRKVGERALKIDPNLKRLEEVVQKLDKVSAGVSTFLHLLDSAKQDQQEKQRLLSEARETGSLPTNDLIGRDKQKDYVMQWLRKPSNEPGTSRYRNISLLSIVGHGGMGKTTLLQHVYEEDEITKEFDLKIWVCVSNSFDVKKVIADMLESLKKERPRLDTLDALQNSLRTEIMSKKFLLILDDIWEEEENRDVSKWEKVFVPLAYGSFGSRILVTTRMESVAMMIATVIKKKTENFRLEGLEEDQCLQLLNSHAFADVENPNDYKRLRSIAGEIVKRLLGSPLAAKVIGGVLNSSLDERHWTKVLNSDFISPKSDQNDIFLILRLSYMFLPKHLQNCFAFCSIFRQDHLFHKDDLVKMWIALGFIQQSHDQEWTMEDIGGMYFDVLVKKSFFDKFRDFGGYYKMHDLIHELAQSISIHECLRVEDGTKLPSIIPKTLRHLFVKTTNPNIMKMIGQFKYLHSLFLFYEDSNQDLCNTLIELPKASRSLRLLYIHAKTRLKMIPEEIGNLIHLRYLKIDGYNLPRSLSNLYHLQYIIYGRAVRQRDLPSDINNLSNLRYVKLLGNFIPSICGIGKLKSLQELNMFSPRDVSGYRIGELEIMNDLCKLGINRLENVKDAEEACSAKLCAKRRLTDLTLCWSWNTGSRNINLDENVLDNLQPSKCLKNLSIEGYMGARSAIWMNNVNPIVNLEKIKLSNCWEWEALPPFGQLPFLKSLKLDSMRKVKWLESKFNGNDKYCAFPLLEVLHIGGLTALEDWFEAGVAAEDGCLFPSLIELKLSFCPKLKDLPSSLPSKLKSLDIDNIGWTTLNFCSNSNPIPQLKTLKVSGCPNITSLPLADEIARLAALRVLIIKNCPNLISLGRYREVETTNNCHLMLIGLWISDPLVLLMEPLRSIASLKWLIITDNDEVVSFPNEAERWFLNVRSSLSELKFSSLKSLQSLPSYLKSLSSLQKLSITKCPNLISLGRYREVETTNNCHLMLSSIEISDPSVLLMEPLRSIASLKRLHIWNNDEVVSFPNEAEQWFLKVSSSLCELHISYLKSLESLPSYLESLSSLQKLHIEDAPMLRELPNLPPSLKHLSISIVPLLRELPNLPPSLERLKISLLKSLESLPSTLESSSSLQHLDIYHVPMLRELPNLPPSLKHLSILGCHPELKERYREDGGSDRHKIAHIPHIYISTR